MYRVQIFNASSWGGWVTVGERGLLEAAKTLAAKYAAKGYETTVYKIN